MNCPVSVNTTSAPSAKILHRPFDGILLLTAATAAAAAITWRRWKLFVLRSFLSHVRQYSRVVACGAASHSCLVSEALTLGKYAELTHIFYICCQCGVRRRRAVAHASVHRWLRPLHPACCMSKPLQGSPRRMFRSELQTS